MEGLDKELVFRNIYFLLKLLQMKVGEFESQTGVSSGYLARASKDDRSKPGGDFLINAAKALKVNLGTLTSVDLSALRPEDEYFLKFMERIIEQTDSGHIDWEKESAFNLNSWRENDEGPVQHPLFSVETYYEETECEYPQQVTRTIMVSHSFKENTAINGDCFNFRMKNGITFYIMNLTKANYSLADHEREAKEVWIYKPHVGSKFICSTLEDGVLSSKAEEIYTSAMLEAKHVRLDADVRRSIDAFMEGDVSDDTDGEIPF
ncbi:MAG: helix-turn-helix transcriptional regulator [Selenomonas sp.]|nr:helix-turn-helix transcriptional regulator [Selenomonas sp.]